MFGIHKKNKANDAVHPVAYDGMPPEPQKKSVRMAPEMMTLVKTDMGNREYQQDAAYVSPSKVLAANKKTRIMALVCDGMGGMADGGRASRTAIEMMTKGFSKIEKMPEVDIPAFFKSGIVAIDRKIHTFPKEGGVGSGTTMVCCIAEDDMLYWASVGDSRIYIFRRGKLSQVTRDHNYWLKLKEMVAAGEISEEEAKNHKKKEALISFLGIGNVGNGSLMDIIEKPIKLEYGDIVLLCSDGITKTLPDKQIERIIERDEVRLEQKAEALVQAAVRANPHYQDNTTVAIMHYHEVNLKEIASHKG